MKLSQLFQHSYEPPQLLPLCKVILFCTIFTESYFFGVGFANEYFLKPFKDGRLMGVCLAD